MSRSYALYPIVAQKIDPRKIPQDTSLEMRVRKFLYSDTAFKLEPTPPPNNQPQHFIEFTEDVQVETGRKGTKPDFLYEKDKVAIYVDGKPHEDAKQIDRDNVTDHILRDRMGYAVIHIAEDLIQWAEIENNRYGFRKWLWSFIEYMRGNLNDQPFNDPRSSFLTVERMKQIRREERKQKEKEE